MKKISTRLMEEKLKFGWTVKDFMHFLECKEEEEFWRAFEIAFSDKAKVDYRRKLKQNQKNHEKSIKQKTTTKHKQEEQIPMSNKITEEQDEKLEKEKSAEEILREMKDREEKLQKEICDIEATKCSLDLKKRDVRIELQGKKEKLVILQSEIRKIGEEVEKCILKMQEIGRSIEMTNAEMAKKKEEMTSLRTEIKNLEKVTILVYENGEVGVEGGSETKFVVDEIWESIFKKLRDDELVEDLTNRQIKLLAKVIAFINTLKSFEVIFEVEELQAVFEKIPNNGLKFFPV